MTYFLTNNGQSITVGITDNDGNFKEIRTDLISDLDPLILKFIKQEMRFNYEILYDPSCQETND